MADFIYKDFRSEEEKKIEKEAYSGVSLESEIDALVDEMVVIGKTDGFLSLEPGGHFDEECRHIRARKIGTILNEKGGLDLMLKVGYRVRARLGSSSTLEVCWGYIGSWMP